ncbi:MAG: type II toxin-antitoxin system RelE/ParE family toxin, partial [Sphingobacteriales bacterium]|nr:type II toxin-antitoxin system RelE/ParE family toxin [Sphingobacteriales bacterium]
MAYEVVLKKRFTTKVLKLLSYLDKEWLQKTAADFLHKLDRRIEQLQKQPYAGRESSKIKNIRGVLITRHNKMYYKITGKKIIILNIYDTRKKKKKNP